MEHQTGLEPVYDSFAENCLAIWLLVQIGEDGRGFTYKMYYLTSILYTSSPGGVTTFIFSSHPRKLVVAVRIELT